MSVDSQTDEYDRDTCYCPHRQAHLSNHLYETDHALRDLILKKNIEYWQNFLRSSGATAIYRIPGTIFKDRIKIYKIKILDIFH